MRFQHYSMHDKPQIQSNCTPTHVNVQNQSKLKVWNKINKYRYIHIFEYKSKESYENCQPIWKKVENELFQGLLVKMVSDKGLLVSETDLTL